MNRRHTLLLAIPALVAALDCAPPHVLVYATGFSFAKYGYMVFVKPAESQSAALYGMDVEIANIMSRYGMTVAGDKEYLGLKPEDKARTLFVRFAVSSFQKNQNLIAISFDDAVTGRTVANLTAQAKGNLFEHGDRAKALARVSEPLVDALATEKGMKIPGK
jgi:hypothetical protein